MDSTSLSSSSADSPLDNPLVKAKKLSPVHAQTPDLTDGKTSDENLPLSLTNDKPSPPSSSSSLSSALAKPSHITNSTSSASQQQDQPDDGWEALWDTNTQQYYFYNRFTNETTWINPRVPPQQSLGERLAKDPEFQCLSKRDKIKRYEYEQQLEQQQYSQQQQFQQKAYKSNTNNNNNTSNTSYQQQQNQPHHRHHLLHFGHKPNYPKVNETEHVQMLTSAFGSNDDDNTIRNKGLRVTKKEFKQFKKKKQQKREKKQREWLLND
jgi:hypothetical protein